MPWRRGQRSRSNSQHGEYTWSCMRCGYSHNKPKWQRCHNCNGHYGESSDKGSQVDHGSGVSRSASRHTGSEPQTEESGKQ
eukprot:2618466-Karenia_brevis.AAC.1